MVMYNIPSRVIVNCRPELLAELAQVDNIVAVKQANDDELGPIEGLAILAGNDNTFLRVLEFGGAGGITVASHVVGEQMREMWDAAQAGDLERAARDRRRAGAPLRGPLGDHQPDSDQGRAGDARPRLRADATAAGPSRRRATGDGQAALEGIGLPVAR